MSRPWAVRVAAGHRRTIAGVVASAVAWAVLPRWLPGATRAVLAWDAGALVLVGLVLLMFAREGTDREMAQNAVDQEEGEWTVFSVVLAGVVFSFVALGWDLAGVRDMTAGERRLHVGLVGATLLLSWLVTHAVFALRYAHEFYSMTVPGQVDGGLEFPGEATPDYWDFGYFALVLGMTFQVSDVQITSRTLRRLAAVHGLIGFLFNTVIVALTVNVAAGVMG